MASELASLFRNLFTLRQYRAMRPQKLPWKIYIAHFRNVIRHQALANWPGGYIHRTDGRLAYVPAHVDVTAGHRLFKPVLNIDIINSMCRPGDCVLDIGANVGDWTMPFALRVGQTGRVLAFEPVPYLADTLVKTSRINRQSWVEVCQLALSSEDGTANFSVEKGNSGGSRLGIMHGDWACISVATRRLDSLLAERKDIDRIDFVKIDVEGHELKVLQGATATLARFRPPLILECGLETTNDRIAIRNLLSGLDYDIIGPLIPGGVVEAQWDHFPDQTGPLENLGLCNYLFMPK